jgi:N-methylhydantoinase B
MRNDIDPLLLEVMKNAFDSIGDEMALILMRTAYSAIVRDSMDYSTAICDAEGQTLGQGLTTPMHLGSFYDAMRHLIGEFAGRIDPGDVFIANDPYAASGQHLPDIYVIKPIYFGETLIGWATTIAHHADVGGLVPGSNSIGATEIYQEGLRLPFLKLVERGRESEAVYRIIETNVRVPDKVLGDLRAQLAACIVAEREYLELFRKYGIERMNQYIAGLHDYSERLARALFRRIPDGIYEFTDHIDGLGENPEPIVLHVKITVADDEVTTDWTGTAPQVKGGINAPLSFTKSNVYAALRSIMPMEVPNCHGFTRPIKVVAPPGTVVSCTHPAPCGARGITGYRIVDCMFGALVDAVPELLTADGTGGSTLPTFGGYHNRKPFVFSECIMGVWGASAAHDGQTGVPHMAANQSNVPIEMIESNYPLRVERYGIEPNTGGAGRFRGGHGLVKEFRLLAEEAYFGVRSDKRRFRPHGLFGGQPGAPSLNVIDPGTENRVLPVLPTEPIVLRRGQVFRHVMAGGGGYGDPFERDPAAVLEDVIDGNVSVESALSDYGVVIASGSPLTVDLPATERTRAAKA